MKLALANSCANKPQCPTSQTQLILYSTLVYSTRLSRLHSTPLYYTILYHTVLYYTTLYYTMLLFQGEDGSKQEKETSPAQASACRIRPPCPFDLESCSPQRRFFWPRCGADGEGILEGRCGSSTLQAALSSICFTSTVPAIRIRNSNANALATHHCICNMPQLFGRLSRD